MIHLACYCGAQLIYLGEEPENLAETDVLAKLKERLGPGDFGILVPAEDGLGACPFCGLLYELPDPSLMEQLPYADRQQFRSALTRFRQTISGKGEPGVDLSAPGRYVS
ncbi:MAG: hypothetical protein JSW55_18300 [Chloroflexota bacterium]|nr:MAG: hypothetical protein JSW55_18300 [Chloroflexota bacterium]